MAALFFNNMKSDDEFLMSKGHAGLTYYAIQVLKGKLKESNIKKMKPHLDKNKKIDSLFTSGSLGHGLAIGLGLAIAKPYSRIYVLIGDGECDEGAIWETIYLAKKLNVVNLVPIIDANKFSVWQKIDTLKLIDVWKGFGWNVIFYEQDEFNNFTFNRGFDMPNVYIVSTIKGKGLKTQDTIDAHGFYLDKEYYEKNIC
jgi:transketolase